MRNRVDKLTTCRFLRQRSDARCRFRHAVLLVTLLGSNAAAEAGPATWQDNAEIAAAAEQFLIARTGRRSADTSVRAAALDPRHKLPRCDRALDAFLRRGSAIGSRTVVGVRCDGTKPWRVFIPVDVVVTADVVSAARSLPQGHLLTADDLARSPRDVSRMRSGYLADAQAAVGRRLKQSVVAGRAITPAMIEADRVVRRGQTVTIVAHHTGISVRMSGQALADGAIGQRIRVENRNSGRIVEGIVRSPEHVEILLAGTAGLSTAGSKVSPGPADTPGQQQ